MVRLLGPVKIIGDIQSPLRFRSPKASALLGYLVAEARPMRRDTLAALFWPDAAEAQALGELRRCLHNLSTLLPGSIRADRQIVQLEVDATTQIDLALFQQLQGQEDIASLTEAAGLYRGEFLEGLDLADCPEFELWLLAEREQWRGKAVSVLQRLVSAHAQRGEYERGIAWGRRWLALDPWNEEAHRQLMLLLARGGQASAALAQYENCRRILAEELAVVPGVETSALYQRIKSAMALRPHNLPPQPTPFIGREVELDEIRQLLANPGCRLLTLVGPGGIGKSRLALEAARRAMGEGSRLFLHGITYVSLAGLESPALLAPTLATALGLSLHTRSPHQAQLLGFLEEKETLLLVDNYEHLLPETTLLAALLEGAPAVKFLVTSRNPLNLHEEWLFDVEELAYPPSDVEMGELLAVEPERLRAYDAVRLFEESARRVQRRFSLAEEGRAVVQICRLVEGMPLALELAAGRLRSLTCTDLARETATNLDILITGQQNRHRRHHSVRVLFESSWAALDMHEQQVLSQLAIFRGGFTQKAAQEVADASLSILAALVEKSFLRLSAAGRYTLHALVRQFAAEKLSATPDQRAATQARHSIYYTHFLQGYEGRIQGPEQQQSLAEIATEIDNVRSAWGWAVAAAKWEAIDAALSTLHRFYESRGWHQEANELFTQALEALSTQAASLSPPQRLTWGRLHAHAALPLIRMGQIPKARTLAETAVALLRQDETSNALAFALNGLGIAVIYGGELEAAEALLEDAAAIYRRHERRGDLVHALSSLGSARLRAGKYELGMETLQEGLALCRDIGDRRGEVTFLHNIATVHLMQGELELAHSRFEECLPLCDEIGFSYVKQIVLENLGEIALKQGDFVSAIALCEQGIEIARELNDRMNLARTLSLLGVALTEADDPGAGWRRLREGLQIAQATHSTPTILAVLDGVATWQLRGDRRDDALALLTFLLQHPATEQQHRDHATQLLGELGADIRPDVSSAYTLDELVSSLLLT
jgi:DNA-binding SARP family transcriptional activator/predicted ATPase